MRLDGNRVLRNVFDCVIFLHLLRFLHTFLTQSVALRALRLAGNRALVNVIQIQIEGTHRVRTHTVLLFPNPNL